MKPLLCVLAFGRVAVLTATVFSAAAFGQTPTATKPQEKPPEKPDDSKPVVPEDIRQKDPGFLVRADVNRATRSYREGDYLSVQVCSEADAHVYVLYKQADGKVFLIFPNSVQTDNRVKARQTVQIPATADMFRWEIGPPFGKEIVKVIASKEPLEALNDPGLREKFFNAVAPKQVKGLRLELGKEDAPAWAEDAVEITTYARDDKIDPPNARRFAALFGISHYEVTEATDGKVGLQSLPCHRDAQKLAAVLREVGQFSDLRVYTNDEATRQNFEQALTYWLPSVSKPGDTVLIYFSGMATTLADGSPQSPSVVLLPYDYIPPAKLDDLLRIGQTEGLPKPFGDRVVEAIRLAEQSGSVARAEPAVARFSGVGNDLFAHWLQALASRQIVLVFDTAYAGAFGPEVARLKGLGQPEIALLGSSGPKESTSLSAPDELSLLTNCLIKTLAAMQGTVTLEQANEVASKIMEGVLVKVNETRKANGKEPLASLKPYMINTCTRPVVLKP